MHSKRKYSVDFGGNERRDVGCGDRPPRVVTRIGALLADLLELRSSEIASASPLWFEEVAGGEPMGMERRGDE